MGYPCLRYEGHFFASQNPTTKRLIVKLPEKRVSALVEAGTGRPFAPAGRVFREWIELEKPDETVWAAMIEEARTFVASLLPKSS